MKNGKRLTRYEKQYLRSLNLNSDKWLLSKKTSVAWLVVHKLTGQVKEVPAP